MSSKTESASVYKSKFAKDKEYIQNIKTAIENLEEVTFFKNARRENENLGYIGENADGTTFRLMFFLAVVSGIIQPLIEKLHRWQKNKLIF